MKLLLADNDACRARALTELLARDPGLTVIRLPPDTPLADAVARHAPDVILVDMARPDRDALEGVRQVAARDPRPVVLFVDQDDPAFMEEAISAGVSSYNVLGLPPPDVKPILRPVGWPLPAGGRGEAGRLFAAGGFPTPDGRARMVPTPYRGRPRAPRDAAGSFVVLNTGRVRDQWHTMTRTGLVPALIAHTPEPRLSLHPADAASLGIIEDSLVRASGPAGEAVLRASLSHAQRRGEAFAPMHWTDAFAAFGPVTRAVAAACDPLSGQPALKGTPVRLAPVASPYAGLLLGRPGAVRLASGTAAPCHWVRVPLEGGELFRLAGLDPAAADAVGDAQLPAAPETELLGLHDLARFTLRRAGLRDGRLEACLFLARTEAALPRAEALLALLGTVLTPTQRGLLLSGRLAGVASAADGPRVCACLGVSREAVRHAVVTHRLASVREIGASLGAGTHCGSCIPELEEILRDVRLPVA